MDLFFSIVANYESGSSDFYFYFFSLIADLKNFGSCNVIQQIKKVWPYRVVAYMHMCI